MLKLLPQLSPFLLGASLLLGLTLWAAPAAQAQAPSWQTLASVPTTGTGAEVTAAAADANGNVYVAGSFTGTASFGGINLSSAGGYDAFVAKWSPVANGFVWAQRAGSATGDDAALAVAASGGNVYAAGYFAGASADFGGNTLANAGPLASTDLFVAKLVDSGPSAAFAWAQRAGGPSNEVARALAVNGPAVYVAGGFTSPSISFGADALNNAGGGNADVFVSKLADAGATSTFVWAQRAGGTGLDDAYALAANGANVYLAGAFNSATVAFGGNALTNAGPGTLDAFVAKLTDAGPSASFGWAVRGGGPQDDGARALAVNGASVYVSGYYYSAAAGFGAATLPNASVGFGSDVFVAKLTDAGPGGAYAWAQRAGGPGNDYAQALAAAGSGVYVVGYFGDAPAAFGATTVASAGRYDVFAARLADAGSTGSFAWAQAGGGSGLNFGAAVAVSGTRVYVGGSVAPPAAFGAQTVPATGGAAAFLASLTDPALPAGHPLALGGLSAYPNPARGAAAVRLPPGAAAADATLTLRDALGRTVRTQHWAGNPNAPTVPLDLAGLPAGVYALQAQSANGLAVTRLVIE